MILHKENFWSDLIRFTFALKRTSGCQQDYHDLWQLTHPEISPEIKEEYQHLIPSLCYQEKEAWYQDQPNRYWRLDDVSGKKYPSLRNCFFRAKTVYGAFLKITRIEPTICDRVFPRLIRMYYLKCLYDQPISDQEDNSESSDEEMVCTVPKEIEEMQPVTTLEETFIREFRNYVEMDQPLYHYDLHLVVYDRLRVL